MPTTATSTLTAANSDKQLEGLNQLRFIAATLVFVQHTLSSCQMDDWIDVGGFRIGRIGTAVFFLLSGFLAAVTTRAPRQWFSDRIVTLFPPYWIVTAGGFILAGVTRTKSFDAWQVVSQLAGTGYFTHGDHIVNIASWFMSPLLLLYIVVTLARMTSVRYVITALIIGLCTAACLKSSEFATLRCHAATFFMAFAVGTCRREQRMVAACGMLSALTILSIIQPEFRYGALAALLLVAALPIRHRIPFCNRFSKISYEWFLVHGLCLAAVCHLTTNRVVISVAGIVLSVSAAMLLQRITKVMTHPLRSPAKQKHNAAEDIVAENITRIDQPMPDLLTHSTTTDPSVVSVRTAVAGKVMGPSSRRRPFLRI